MILRMSGAQGIRFEIVDADQTPKYTDSGVEMRIVLVTLNFWGDTVVSITCSGPQWGKESYLGMQELIFLPNYSNLPDVAREALRLMNRDS